MLTEILLQVTTSEIKNVANEVYEDEKSKRLLTKCASNTKHDLVYINKFLNNFVYNISCGLKPRK